ncbi:MAG: ABC transporter permease [Thermoplasmata archaeon]
MFMHIGKKIPRTISDSKSFPVFVWIISIIVILFFVVPIIRLITYVSPQYLFSQFMSATNMNSIKITVIGATISSIIVVLFGFPLAYLLARYKFAGKKIMDSIIEVPIMIPHSVVGIALLLVFATAEPGGTFLNIFNISFGYNMLAVVMAYIFVSGTYAIKTMEEAIKSIDPRIELVARTLGASQWQVISKVMIPQTARSILTGTILSWGRAMSEVGAILIVAPYILPEYQEIAGVQVYNQFEVTGLTGAVGLSSVLIIISIVIFIVLKVVQGQHKIFYVPGVER